MSLVGIQHVWHRQITRGDFFNIERTAGAGPQSGGGQLFIDIPNTVREGLFTMLGLEAPADVPGAWPAGEVDAKVIGHPTESGTLRFGLTEKATVGIESRIKTVIRQMRNATLLGRLPRDSLKHLTACKHRGKRENTLKMGFAYSSSRV